MIVIVIRRSRWHLKMKPTSSELIISIYCSNFQSQRKLAKPVITSSEAAAKISDLVEEKQAYYRRKLEILNEEHEAKMRVLALKEQFYLNKKNIIII